MAVSSCGSELVHLAHGTSSFSFQSKLTARFFHSEGNSLATSNHFVFQALLLWACSLRNRAGTPPLLVSGDSCWINRSGDNTVEC